LQHIKDKSPLVEKDRKVNKGVHLPWTEELDKELKGMYYDALPVAEIAKHLNRSEGAIMKRLQRLDCVQF
ncbi:MAG TPA: hypothetical protein VF610_09545, partial [Segetibacter sp.]